MKTKKKLLNSALLLGFAIGQTGGPVVEALSILSTSNSANKKVTTTIKTTKESKEESSKEKSKDSSKEKETNEKKESKTKSNQSVEKNLTIPDISDALNNVIASYSLPSLPSEYSRAIPVSGSIDQAGTKAYLTAAQKQYELTLGDNRAREVQDGIAKKINSVSDNYNVNTQLIIREAAVMFYDDYSANLPNNTTGLFIDDVSIGRRNHNHTSQNMTLKRASAVSESGNWHIDVVPTNAAAIKLEDGQLDVILTRLKIAPPQQETFNIPMFQYTYYGEGGGNNFFIEGHISVRKPVTISVNFPSAENAIGKLKTTLKSSTNTLTQNQTSIPDPSTYIEVSNHRGSVNYRWKTSPETTKVGQQEAVVTVSDQTGRSEDVTVPITVEALPVKISAKQGPFEIYQYSVMPDAANYFDVENLHGSHRVEWINNANTNTAGSNNWQARVTTSDGRTASASITMNILSHPGLAVKLKDVADIKLGSTMNDLSTNFREYIEEATSLGETIDKSSLQYIASESVIPDPKIVGTQKLKIAVQYRHPNSGAMIKGSAEIPVNVVWGDTILLRSTSGGSAGAFSLRPGSSSGSYQLVASRGLDSPADISVGPSATPFGLYYQFELLRNNQVYYTQEVSNRATVQQIMDQFGGAKTVQLGDVVKIYHPGKTLNSSVVMIDEKEHDFTYGSEYAYYKVTAYGFDPVPIIDAEGADKEFILGESTNNIDPGTLIHNVTINGQKIDKSQYEVESLIDFDTSTIGSRKMRLKINMKDGIASKEFEIDYRVKWGSTFILKGLNDVTAGAFSLLNENGQWALHSNQGISGTDLNGMVNNHFGRNTYYSVEVLDGTIRKYYYEVAGNSSIREAINGFNNGQPLRLQKGNVIKVYHAEATGKNLLMEDELVKDYTVGSDYAYYQVTDHGLEPVLDVVADAAPQEFTLGEAVTGVDGTKLIKSITVNGLPLASTLYTVEQLEEFDTTTAGSKNLRIKFETKDGMVSKEITVPYEVKWGNTILMRSIDGAAAGAFSLRVGDTSASSIQIAMTKGLDTPGNVAVGSPSMPFELYYSFEVLRNDRVVYTQEVANRVTVDQAIASFGNANHRLTVQVDDIIKVYHPDKTANGSVVMMNEQEKDFTYGTEYAYYKVTSYGFEPAPVMEAEGEKNDLLLGEDQSAIEPNQLIKNVKINGREINKSDYTVEFLSNIDTQTVGTRKVNLKVTAKDGLSSDEIEAEYTVKWGDSLVLKGLNNTTVGAFSLLKENKQWMLHSTQGVTGTNLSDSVNNLFGRQVYYRLEVIKGVSSSFTYEVLGNSTIGEAVNGFNNGSPLTMAVGDVIKVYHAETNGKNLFMMDEIVKDFTVGTNDAYYEVTEEGLEPILAVSVDSAPKEFTLGDITTNVDGTSLVNSVTVNGSPLTPDQYTVKQLGEFDTTTAGKKELRIQFDTKDGNISKEITVPYEVKWGNTILLKSENGHSAGAFSLHTTNGSGRQLAIHPGLDTPENEQISSDSSLYYSIEVLRNGASAYIQEIPGSATLQQVMNNFGTNKTVSVQFGDVIKIYHPQRTDGSSVLYVNETAEDYTYGSPYAYYEVTAYGFKALPVMEAESANKEFFLGADTANTDLTQLFSDVRINGETITEDLYTIEKVTDFDTSTIPTEKDRTVKIKLAMKDGLAALEMDVPYKVRWGSTFVLKGLDDATAGAFSIINQDDNWSIKATKGEDTTILENPVNNVFGRDVYYRIEVVENPDAEKVASPLEAIKKLQNGEIHGENTTSTFVSEPPLVIVNEGMPLAESTDKVKYSYEVTGNMTIGQAIKGFNNGQPLAIDEGDIIKVYHAEPGSRNLLMRDDLVKNFTGGSNYAHYQVSNHEFDPITDIQADTVTQELTLGEDPSEVDPAKLIENVRFNGQKLADNLYTVEQTDTFDTNTAGAKTLNVKVATADGVTTRDVSVPYEVKWGSTIQLKNRNGDTVGSFGLLKNKEQLQIQSMKGDDNSVLSNRITEFDDNEVYYGIEVLNRSGSKYKYEVRGTQTIEQAISRFNSGKPLNVTVGEIVKVYHADSNSNLLMSEEMERNFTYGSNYAYYEVTEYGFEPTGEFLVEPAEAKIVKGTERVDLKTLLKEVKLNGKDVPKNSYSVTLDPDMEIDTSKLGSQTVKLTVKADRSYGGFSTETEATFEIVEEGQEGQTGQENGGTADGSATGSDTAADEASSGNLPKTNEKRTIGFSILGLALVAIAGFLMFWKKQKGEGKKEEKTQ